MTKRVLAAAVLAAVALSLTACVRPPDAVEHYCEVNESCSAGTKHYVSAGECEQKLDDWLAAKIPAAEKCWREAFDACASTLEEQGCRARCAATPECEGI